jgi:hypothetical protein
MAEFGETTMKAKRLALYCLAGLLAGCVPIVSLQPLFTKESITFDEKLLGVWIDSNEPGGSWEFARFETDAADRLPDDLKADAGRLYRLNASNKEGNKGSFVACLVKLENRLFLDVFPDLFPSGEADVEKSKLLFNAFLFLRTHTFVRVDFVGDQLKLGLTDDEGFKKLAEAEPKAVAFMTADDRPVLTASTKDLQTFVTKYADDDRLFPTDLTLTRKSK